METSACNRRSSQPMHRKAVICFSLFLLSLLNDIHAAVWPGSHASPFSIDSNVEADRDPKAGPFTVIGGFGIAPPCCVSHGTGRMDCFRIDPESNLFHITKSDGVYGSWKEVGNIPYKGLECVSRKEGIIDVLTLNNDFFVVSKRYTDGEWEADWKVLDPDPRMKSIDVPSCFVISETRIGCGTRGLRSQAIAIIQVNGVWNPSFLKTRLNLLMSPVECVALSQETDCFAVGVDSSMMTEAWQKRRGQRIRSSLGGLFQGKPMTAVYGEGDIGLFALNKKNSLMFRGYDGEWAEWYPLGGKFNSVPQCTGFSDGALYCFGIGEKSWLYRRTNEAEGWYPAYGTFIDGHACVITNTANKEVTCMLRGFDMRFVEVVYTLK